MEGTVNQVIPESAKRICSKCGDTLCKIELTYLREPVVIIRPQRYSSCVRYEHNGARNVACTCQGTGRTTEEASANFPQRITREARTQEKEKQHR